MSVKTDSIESTTKESIMDEIARMVPCRPIPVAARKTVKDVNPEKGTNYTSKDKIVLGIPDDSTITWSYPSFDFRDSSMLKILAKNAGMTASDLCSSIVMTWFNDHREEIEAISADSLKEQSSIEELQKEIESANRAIARRQEMIARLRSQL